MCIGSYLIVNYDSSLLMIPKVSMLMTDQKARLNSHLHITTCMTLYCYWLVINHGCKQLYDWLSYTILTWAGIAQSV